MKFRAILSAFYSTPLAILPEKLAAIQMLLRAKAIDQDVSAEEIAEIVASRRPDGVQMMGRVAILPVMGTLAQRVGIMGESSGGVGADQIGQRLDALVSDRGVKCIVMAFDSPGGSVYGIGELADKIRGHRDTKKIIGVADSVAASAAYWCLAQCSEINVTPGGMVGSIGVLVPHQDVSKSEDAEGVKTTIISSGKYKAEGNPYEPLSDEAREELQSKCNAYYGQFVGDVAKGRGVTANRVEKDFGQGRMCLAADAVARGMADRVANMETVLRRYGASGPEAASPNLKLAALRAGLAEAE